MLRQLKNSACIIRNIVPVIKYACFRMLGNGEQTLIDKVGSLILKNSESIKKYLQKGKEQMYDKTVVIYGLNIFY